MDDVAKIKEAIDIAELISEYVPLKKSGRNFKACCPFHQEKTPSFYVSAERQSWHCFGCSRGGDCFTFLMEMEKIEFIEALRYLAKKTGITLTQSYQATEQQQAKDRIYQIHHLLGEYYHYILTEHKTGERARAYLKNRGVHDRTIKTFGLGYAPNSWDAQLKFLFKKGYSAEELERSGLVIKGRGGSVYDRFRGRLMFPIRDHRGQTIAFAGRSLDPNAKDAKYINSPETPIYTKGNTLYGLDVTKDEIKKEGRALLVEGEFDLLSSFQTGVGNVVAIKGSAITEGQIKLLKRFTDTLVFALDSDIAGDEAAKRGIVLADEAGFLMEAVLLPSGKDPDECIKESEGLWKKAVKETVPIYDYLLMLATKRYDPHTVEGKKRISDEMIPILAKIANPIIAGHYARELAKLLSVSEETVIAAVEKAKKTQGQKPLVFEQTQPEKKQKRQERLEEVLVALLLQSEQMEIVTKLSKEVSPDDFTLPPLTQLFQLAKHLVEKRQKLPLSNALAAIPDELVSTFDRLLLLPIDELVLPNGGGVDIDHLLTDFTQASLYRKIKLITTKIRQIEEGSIDSSEKQAKLEELNTILRTLTDRLKTLQGDNRV